MATTTLIADCVKCGKKRAIAKCAGCSQEFCYNHFTDHHQELSKQFEEIEFNRNLFRQTLTQQTNDLKEHSLIQQINKWEEDSIRNIQEIATECRQILSQHVTKHIDQIEVRFAKLTGQLRQIREENDFNEIDLSQFNETLNQLAKELDKHPDILIERDFGSFANKISTVVSSEEPFSLSQINIKTKWMQNGITIDETSGQSHQTNKFLRPQGIYVDDDNESVYIADTANHRIIECDSQTNIRQVVAGGNGQGNRTDQLDWPTDVTVDKKNDLLIICDRGNRRVVQWPRKNGKNGRTIIPEIDCYGVAMGNNGDIYVSDKEQNEVTQLNIASNTRYTVAGGNGKGNRLSQLNSPTYIFVDRDRSVYVSDSENNRVMKWMDGASEGIVVAGGQGQGNKFTQLSNPCGVFVDKLGDVYVADSDNNRIMHWPKGSRRGSCIPGGNRNWSKQFDCLEGLSIDQQGNLYAVVCGNDTVIKIVDPN